MAMFFKSKSTRAEGYPETDVVQVKIFEPTNDVVLKNGFNIFRIPIKRYAKVTFEPGEANAFNLVGTDNGVSDVLASFGSKTAVINALDGYAAAVTGVRKRLRWMRAGLSIVAIIVLLNVSASMVRASGSSAPHVAANLPTDAQQLAMQEMQRPPAPAGDPAAEIERLAAGGEYQFKPKIAMPVVQAPQLACDTPAKK